MNIKIEPSNDYVSTVYLSQNNSAYKIEDGSPSPPIEEDFVEDHTCTTHDNIYYPIHHKPITFSQKKSKANRILHKPIQKHSYFRKLQTQRNKQTKDENFKSYLRDILELDSKNIESSFLEKNAQIQSAQPPKKNYHVQENTFIYCHSKTTELEFIRSQILTLNSKFDANQQTTKKENIKFTDTSLNAPLVIKSSSTLQTCNNNAQMDIECKYQRKQQKQKLPTRNIPRIYIIALLNYLSSNQIKIQIIMWLRQYGNYYSDFDSFLNVLRSNQTVKNLKTAIGAVDENQSPKFKSDEGKKKFNLFSQIIRKCFLKFLREESNSYFYCHNKIKKIFERKRFYRSFIYLLQHPEDFYGIQNPDFNY